MTEAEIIRLLYHTNKPAAKVKCGKFEGKLGTPVRSRKGRTYRKGNGYINYVPTYAELDHIFAPEYSRHGYLERNR